jgi:hypothetical protein
MRRLVAAAFVLVVCAEVIALTARDRQLILIIAGGAVALALLGLRWYLVQETEAPAGHVPADDAAKGLQRWLSRTETLISHSETTRRDWDRHLRPMLARQYEMATGQKRNKDRTSYQATGRMLFGTELWDWVNPENVTRTGTDEPGPGRGALDEILQRLERI